MTSRAASRAVMATRTAVSRALVDLREEARVLVACSGGPDSLALVAAAAWVSDRAGLLARAVVIDHGLQADSATVAAAAATASEALGMPADVRRVEVSGSGGPEAAARKARYTALEEGAGETGAAAVLLGHTREDQAETVLLRLTRGAGARSLAAMSARSGLWRRPFLDLPRSVVRAAADDVLGPLGLRPWADPHNEDPAFARVRARALLDGLTAELGDSVVLGLSRSAALLREDADALEEQAIQAYRRLVTVEPDGWTASCDELAALPAAVRTRVIRSMAQAAGAPGEDLDFDHVQRVRDFVDRWHGQGEASLPGGVRAERVCGRLWLRSPSPENGVAGGS